MTLRIFSPEEARRTGTLKWTGITREDGSPTIGAWVAEMDFGTSPAVAAAMKAAIDEGLLGYQPKWLASAMADATASFQAERFGWSIEPAQVRLVASVLPALEAVIRNLIPEGAPVIVPTPAYMPFLTIPIDLGHPVIEVPSLRGEAADGRGWALDLEGIRRGLEAGAGLVILCNPWNPTGRVLSEAELRAFDGVLDGSDALVFSDEIHSPLVLDDVPFISYARVSGAAAARTVTATAASKGWNIAGLPSAQVILPDDSLAKRWDSFGQRLASGASVIGTIGQITAYTSTDSWQSEVLDYIRLNVDAVEQALANSPIAFTRPEGTYLTWWGFEGLGLEPSPGVAMRELAGIGVNDGKDLGADYSRWARVNLATSHEVVADIIERTLALVSGTSLR